MPICRSVLECTAPKMCHLSTEDQYGCQSNHGIAEAVTGVLGGAQFSSGPFYHPRSSRGRFGHPREAAVGAGNFPDSNGVSGDFKRQNRSHQTEPVPTSESRIYSATLITLGPSDGFALKQTCLISQMIPSMDVKVLRIYT